MKNTLLKVNARGHVRVWTELNGQRRLYHESRNTIVYSASEALNRLLAGQSEYKVGGIYFQFQNLASAGDPITPVSVAQTDTVDTFQALSSPNGFVRAALSLEPAISTQGASYSNNRGTYYASIAESAIPVTAGITFGNSQNSALSAAGLVATPTSDYLDDILIARVSLTKLIPQVGMKIGVEWIIDVKT